MGPEELEFVASTARSRAGLMLRGERTFFIESRLASLARRENEPSPQALVQKIRASRDETLILAMVEALAAPETSFFRDRAPFDRLRDDVLPQLAASRPDGVVRVWCAGCSTGQEAYSLAMMVDENRARFPKLQLAIIATDLSERALEKARAGLYTQFEVQRGLPIRQLLAHFEKIEDNWRLTPRIRQRVRWRRVNLITDLSIMGRFDVIFCRNVLSAMDPPYRRRVLESLAALLPADGLLILGATETAETITEAFRPVPGRAGLYVRNPAFRIAA